MNAWPFRASINKALPQRFTKFHSKKRDLVAEEQAEVVGGTVVKIDSGNDGGRKQ